MGAPVSLRVVGVRAYKRSMRGIGKEVRRRMRRKIRRAANVVKVAARAEIGSGGPRKLANRSGKLRRRISVSVSVRKGRSWRAEIGPRNPQGVYGRVHELGMTTNHPSGPRRYPARPFMEPATRKSRAKVLQILGRVWTGIG